MPVAGVSIVNGGGTNRLGALRACLSSTVDVYVTRLDANARGTGSLSGVGGSL